MVTSSTLNPSGVTTKNSSATFVEQSELASLDTVNSTASGKVSANSKDMKGPIEHGHQLAIPEIQVDGVSVVAPQKKAQDVLVVKKSHDEVSDDSSEEAKADKKFHYHEGMSRQQAEAYLNLHPEEVFVTRPSSRGDVQAMTFKSKVDGKFKNYLVSVPKILDGQMLVHWSGKPTLIGDGSSSVSLESLLRFIETGR